MNSLVTSNFKETKHERRWAVFVRKRGLFFYKLLSLTLNLIKLESN